MLDHASLGVSDVERSQRFYDAALRPLGLVRIVDFGEGRGSDYGAAPGSTGVQFTITRESAAQPSAGAHQVAGHCRIAASEPTGCGDIDVAPCGGLDHP